MTSNVGIKESQQIQTSAGWLFLMTISLPDGDILRLVNNSEDFVSRGVTYNAFPFQIILPSDDAESLPVINIAISMLSPDMVEVIRGFPTAPDIKIELVTTLTPDVVEKSIEYAKLVSVSYDAFTINGSMTIINVLTAPFGETYLPSTFGGLFVV